MNEKDYIKTELGKYGLIFWFRPLKRVYSPDIIVKILQHKDDQI